MQYVLFTDGGSRSNPGKAAIGVVLKDNTGKTIDTISKFIGIQTNNYAEYTGLIEGLKMCIEKGIKEVICTLDSELVVKQINGLYKVKEETLKLKWQEITELKKCFDKISFVHVLRTKNKEADALVNKALDELG